MTRYTLAFTLLLALGCSSEPAQVVFSEVELLRRQASAAESASASAAESVQHQVETVARLDQLVHAIEDNSQSIRDLLQEIRERAKEPQPAGPVDVPVQEPGDDGGSTPKSVPEPNQDVPAEGTRGSELAPQSMDAPEYYPIVVGTSRGVAVGIDGNRAVTVRHIGSGEGKIKVRGEWLSCRVVPLRDRDMAAVYVEGGRFMRRVAAPRVSVGQPVYMVSGRTGQRMEGRVTWTLSRSGNREVRFRVLNGPGIFPGDSGSPVYDFTGRIVGVAVGHIGPDHRAGVFAPMPEQSLDFLTGQGNEGAKPKIWVTQADFPCAPCEALKRSIAAGAWNWADVETIATRPGITSYPAIEFIDAMGTRRIRYGFNANVPEEIRRLAH